MPEYAPDSPKEGFDAIPMWIADMNFPVAPSIIDALQKRISHPSFGYFALPDEYYSSIIEWQKLRNGVIGLKKCHIGYENGVLGGLISALNVFCSDGDNVLIHSPTYSGFTKCIENRGYHIVHSALQADENGVPRMNFEDMEEKIVENKIHAAVFCSPHNPSGRVWEEWEISRAMELFKKHDVMVISDEIWSDIILHGSKFIPTQSVSEDAKMRTVALYAPSKTFNLAGLVGSYHIIYNSYIRDRIEKESSLAHYNTQNVLSVHALIGAYTLSGAEWTNQLCDALTNNVDFACDFISKHFSGIKVQKPQGTYMLFLDCAEWCLNNGKSLDELIKAGWDVGVMWQDGRRFNGACHIRMNLALPLSRVQEAFDRLSKYVFNVK